MKIIVIIKGIMIIRIAITTTIVVKEGI